MRPLRAWRPHAAPRRPRRVVRERPSVAVIALAAVGAALFVLPLVALVVRAPWSDAWSIVNRPEMRTALRLSLVCSLSATALSIVLGLPLAWVQARTEFPGKALLRALTTLPVVLPPVVGGVALLLALGRNGLVGRYLHDWFGVRLPFTTAAAVIAETFVAMPFFVLAMEGAFAGADRRLEEAAAVLGASRRTVLLRVVLPALRPGFIAAAVLCWARALGEFGATITFAGNFPGTTQTMPLAVYQAFETDPPAATVLGLVLVAVSLTVLVALRRRLVVR